MTTQELKDLIQSVVKTNGEGQITGANLQDVLLKIVDNIGGGGGASEPIEIAIDLDALAAYRTSQTDKVEAFDAIPKSVMMEALGVTEDNLIKIMAGNAVLYNTTGGEEFFHCFHRYEDGGLNISYDSLNEPYLFNSMDGVVVISLLLTQKENETYAFRRGEIMLAEKARE